MEFQGRSVDGDIPGLGIYDIVTTRLIRDGREVVLFPNVSVRHEVFVVEVLGCEEGGGYRGGGFADVERVEEGAVVDCDCVVGARDDAEGRGEGVD